MLKKIIFILIILLNLTGCSAIKKAQMEEEIKQKKWQEERIEREKIYYSLQNYRADKNYQFYKIEDKKNKIEILNKYFIYKSPYFSPEYFTIYQYGKSTERIYVDNKVYWEMIYKAKGYRHSVKGVNEFEFKIIEKNSKKEIKTEIGELTERRKDEALIPDIKSIEYEGEKIIFEIKEIDIVNKVRKTVESSVYIDPNEISILKNGEEIGIMLLHERLKNSNSRVKEYDYGGVYIKNSVDEKLKSFIFQTVLAYKQHKMMRIEIRNKMEGK
jgi:hypothetical protein